MSTSYADRSLIAMSAAVALFAVAVRVHDIVAFPVLHDFDAAGHALNVVDLYEGHLPDLRAWCGSHPPLYYALGAALLAFLPEGVPVHVMLRSISVVSWVAAVALVWRTLRRLTSDVDAAVVAALLLGVPGILIASCMMTNDMLCALLVTATLVRLLPTQGDEPPTPRHAALTGVVAGLAALTKTPGLWAAGMAAVWYAWRSRHSVRSAIRNLLTLGLVAGGIAAPHYARMLTYSGSSFDFMTAMSSPEKRAIVAAMLATGDLPHHLWPLALALLHITLWGDPVAMFLPRVSPVQGAMLALLVGGAVVLGVAVVGAARLVARRELARPLWAPLGFGVLVALLMVFAFWKHPHPMVIKATFVLPALLPVGLVIAFGVGAIPGVWRVVVRGALLAVAAGGAALTWYGWWAPVSITPPRITLGNAPRGAAVDAVERYFRYRADDPIRAMLLLGPQLQRAHGLRLASVLGLSVSSEPRLPVEDSALELAQAQVAWMELYNLVGWLQPVAAALRVTVAEAHEGADDAWVNVRITASGSKAPDALPVGSWPFAAFEQRFTLRRSGGEWRITAIEQQGVSDENALAAFVASPTLAGFERLRSLGWRPNWGLAPPRSEPPAA